MWDGRPTIVVGVRRALEEAAGAEVDEIEPVGVEVDDEVFVFDVSMRDASVLYLDDRVYDVVEPPTTERRLAQTAATRYVVEQVLSRSHINLVSSNNSQSTNRRLFNAV